MGTNINHGFLSGFFQSRHLDELEMVLEALGWREGKGNNGGKYNRKYPSVYDGAGGKVKFNTYWRTFMSCNGIELWRNDRTFMMESFYDDQTVRGTEPFIMMIKSLS